MNTYKLTKPNASRSYIKVLQFLYKMYKEGKTVTTMDVKLQIFPKLSQHNDPNYIKRSGRGYASDIFSKMHSMGYIDYNNKKCNITDKGIEFLKQYALLESINVLRDNNYIVLINEDLKKTLGKAAAVGALAASSVFGNSGIEAHEVGPNDVPGDTTGFGKTKVHLQHRYNYPSTFYGVPKNYKLPDGENKFEISHEQELELTKRKILSTPDSILKKYGKEHTEEIAELMIKTATKYNVDIDILLAIAGGETGFKNDSKSHKKAIGIMQITPIAAYDSHTRLQGKKAKTYDFNDFADLTKNIDNAGRIIADLSKRRRNVIEMILASYNGGTAQANAWRGEQLGTRTFNGTTVSELSEETRDYVKKCMGLYKLYKHIQSTYEF